jgi:hypothetical protein
VRRARGESRIFEFQGVTIARYRRCGLRRWDFAVAAAVVAEVIVAVVVVAAAVVVVAAVVARQQQPRASVREFEVVDWGAVVVEDNVWVLIVLAAVAEGAAARKAAADGFAADSVAAVADGDVAAVVVAVSDDVVAAAAFAVVADGDAVFPSSFALREVAFAFESCVAVASVAAQSAAGASLRQCSSVSAVQIPESPTLAAAYWPEAACSFPAPASGVRTLYPACHQSYNQTNWIPVVPKVSERLIWKKASASG